MSMILYLIEIIKTYHTLSMTFVCVCDLNTDMDCPNKQYNVLIKRFIKKNPAYGHLNTRINDHVHFYKTQ